MAQVEVISEREYTGGWAFEVQVLDDRGDLSKHEMRLSWADYNLWSPDGSDEPTRVAEAVFMFLVTRTDATELPARFDASIARRKSGAADVEIPSMIRR